MKDKIIHAAAIVWLVASVIGMGACGVWLRTNVMPAIQKEIEALKGQAAPPAPKK